MEPLPPVENEVELPKHESVVAVRDCTLYRTIFRCILRPNSGHALAKQFQVLQKRVSTIWPTKCFWYGSRNHEIRPCVRSGHHEFSGTALRPRRYNPRPRATRVTADLPARQLGRT